MRRERFVEELESYSKQLEEFQTFGDMQEIQRYLKKAQALNQRLESAAEKVGLSIFVILKESFLPLFNKNKALDRILELDSYIHWTILWNLENEISTIFMGLDVIFHIHFFIISTSFMDSN